MIKMQNVRKTYPGFDFELSLEIPEGRITGLIGKNGAGKSTIFKLLLGLYEPQDGQVLIKGIPECLIVAWAIHVFTNTPMEWKKYLLLTIDLGGNE